ncbi:chemotaxis protein CheW [Halostella pelagica]|uniref:chemotaxis protein CheW n=1 Tax=Halostella pelagica TaxID=2583824 RepID=UPI001080A3F8|nr:chemotaxis protein CheW [Halostella pelagica]
MSTDLPEELLGVDDIGLEEENTERDGDGGDEEQEEHERVLVFSLGEQRYGLDVGDVRNIVEVGERTRVPRSGEAVDGIMDMRGDITAVIDPRKLLPVSEPVESEANQRIVVFDRSADKQSASVRIDTVEGVESFPVSQIRRDDAEFGMPAGDLVKAVVEIPDDNDGSEDDPATVERISILNPDRLLDNAN